MEWIKEWTDSDTHPKMVAAGFWGREVFRCLCRLSGYRDLGGEIPTAFLDGGFLANYLGVPGPDAAANCAQGVRACITSGLLISKKGRALIKSWEDRQPSQSKDALRKRELRERRPSGVPTLSRPRPKNVPSVSQKRPLDLEVDLEVDLEKKKKPLVPELPGTERVGPVPHSFDEKGNRPEDQVFEHWRQKLRPKAHVFDDDTRKKVLARLKEGFTVEELKQAIDGCASNPHNQGVNDKQKRYDSLELICRNGGNVARFQGYTEKPASEAFKPGGFHRAEEFTGQHDPPGIVDLTDEARFGPMPLDFSDPAAVKADRERKLAAERERLEAAKVRKVPTP